LAFSDRIRMFENRALLSLSYENREDNTAKTKVATTKYGNTNGSLTVFPSNTLPSFTIGYGILTRKSDANPTDSLQRLYVADDQTNRISVQLNYDFTLGGRQNLSFGVNLSSKTDNTFYKRDQKNNSYFGSLTTYFSFPLQTTLSFNTNMSQSSELTSGSLANLTPIEFNLTAISLNAQYRLLEDKLRLATTVSTSTGDLNRTLAQAGVEYSVSMSQTLSFQYDYIQNSGYKDDSIMNLVYRFNF